MGSEHKVRWIMWLVQAGNAAHAVTTIVAWPHPWFHESSWLILMAVRLLGLWGGVVAVKLLWALLLWWLAMGAVGAMGPLRTAGARYIGMGIAAGLAAIGWLFWLAAIANALSIVQHVGR